MGTGIGAHGQAGIGTVVLERHTRAHVLGRIRAFDQHIREGAPSWLAGSEAARPALAENYVGLAL